jgi:hypothetical protein
MEFVRNSLLNSIQGAEFDLLTTVSMIFLVVTPEEAHQ